MKIRRMMGAAVVLVVTGLLISGCAGTYGELTQEGTGGMTVEVLLRDWQNYNINYTGMIPERPLAILFDPKNDGKNLELEGLRWWSINDEKTLREKVGRVSMLSPYNPRVWRIVGPNDSFFGYAYTPAIKLNIIAVNENTLRVTTP